MIVVKKENNHISVLLDGYSDSVLIEFQTLLKALFDKFYQNKMEDQLLEAILDVVSDFVEEHTQKTKGEEKDD